MPGTARPSRQGVTMSTSQQKTYNVLFLCTGNSARSIMAEALLNTMGKGRFNAYSAGSHPAGAVNPLALEQIHATGYPLNDLRSKSWDEFAAPDAPKMDFIITVCDNAKERCPYFPTKAKMFHYNFPDPAKATGTEEEIKQQFRQVRQQIKDYCKEFIDTNI